GPAATGLCEIALRRAVRVPVIFDNRQANLAGSPDGLDDLLDVRIPIWPVINGIRETRDHQVTEDETVSFEAIQHLLEAAFFPGNAATAGDHMIHAKLADSLGSRPGLLIRTCRAAWRRTEACLHTYLGCARSLEARAVRS